MPRAAQKPTKAPQKEWAVLNGEALCRDDCRASAFAAGLQSALGVYTTFRVAKAVPCLFERHHARLVRDAQALGLAAPRMETLLVRVMECIHLNGITEGAMKVVLFQDAVGCSELVQLRGPSPLAAMATVGCTLHPTQGPPLSPSVAVHKTLAYLPHLLARRQAAAAGFDEALWVDRDGVCLECAGANFLVLSGGRFLTTPTHFGVLPGVIRSLLLEHAPCVQELPVTREVLAQAEAAFVCNSLIGVIPVLAIGARSFDVQAASCYLAMLTKHLGH